MTRRLFAVAMLALAAPLSAAPKKHERSSANSTASAAASWALHARS
jgi:hypothetical protein